VAKIDARARDEFSTRGELIRAAIVKRIGK
jgi:hypothetical protein